MSFRNTVLVGLLLVAGCHADTSPSPWGQLPWGSLDYVQYYVALELVHEGSNPYDQKLAGDRQMSHGRGWGMQMFVPPWGLLPGLLVTYLPFPMANYANIALNALLLIFCAVCWTKMLFPDRPWYVPIMVLACFLWAPSLVNMEYGQNALWPLAGFTGWLWFTQKKCYATAGVWLALTVIKPHLGLLPALFALVYSLRQRHWATLATSIGGVLAATLATFMLRPNIWHEYHAAMQTGLSPSLFKTYTLNGMALPYMGPSIQYVTYALVLAVIYSITVRTWNQFKVEVGSDEQPAKLVTWSMVICMMVLPFATYAWLTDFVLMVPGCIVAVGRCLQKDRVAWMTMPVWIAMSVWLSIPSWMDSFWIVPWLGWGLTVGMPRLPRNNAARLVTTP